MSGHEIPEGMPPIPEGALMHYTTQTLSVAAQSPSPLCGDLESGEHPLVGLTPIKAVVNCEKCKALMDEPPPEGITPVTFGANFTTGHSNDCTDEDCALNSLIGVRGVDVDGETYLSREDVLQLIGNLWQSTHNLSHKAEEEGGEDAAPKSAFFHMLAQGINMVGSILHAQTQPQNAINTSLPDSLEDLLKGGWEDKPAAESPIDRMIREATEAAAAKKADANQSQEDQQ